MQTMSKWLSPVQATRLTSDRRQERISKCQCLPIPLKLMAFLRQAMAAPEDAKTFFLEVLKFIVSGALITATGVVLLMMA